jgi:hypothetical protein
VPEENRKVDDVEKILHEEKSLEDRKQAVIADLLKQREAAIEAFDEKLAKLGYHGNSGKTKRSHHKRGAAGAAPAAPAKAADKPKA